MKYFLIIIVSGLIGFALGYTITPDNDVDVNKLTKPLHDTIFKQDTIIENLTRVRQEMMSQDAIERAQFNAKEKTYKITLERFKSNVRATKSIPDVDSIIRHSRDIERLILTYDSALHVQDARFDAIFQENERLLLNEKILIENFETQIQAERLRYAAQTEITDEYKAALKREKKKKLGWKILRWAGVGYLIFRSIDDAN